MDESSRRSRATCSFSREKKLDYAEGYAIAERAPALRIVVERDNTPARAFYRRAGFVPVEGELFERSLPSG